MRHVALCFLLATVHLSSSMGQDHVHGDGSTNNSSTKIEAPKVFLDKSPRIVAYQLKRLDNQRLLMVERRADDAKYIPVYQAILTRTGMSPQYRLESIGSLAKLQKSDPVVVVLSAIDQLDATKREQQRTAGQLTKSRRARLARLHS